MLTDNSAAPLLLIVEDNESHAELIQHYFEDAPREYRLEIVGTIFAAKQAIDRRPPNLVMTDYRLPDGEGIELVRVTDRAWPVVLMTSHGNEQVAVDAMKAGAQDYVVKSSESFSAIPRIAARSLREWNLIQESKRLEQQLQQAQKLESLGVLAGGIAHDFNNILTVILGHCYMARENIDPEQSHEARFQQIETSANRAAELCRQMLTYAGKSQLIQTRVNLSLLVDEVVNMLKSAIKKNVTIELDLDRDVQQIKGDISQIQQIVMNLVINAAEAIGDANGTICVELSKTVIEAVDQTNKDAFGTTLLPASYVCLKVTDNGCGMDEETQRRIFEPFYTTKFTGRGLGMSAISGIIKSHEGLLQLTSTPDVGTTFKVYFPLPVESGYQEAFPSTTENSKKFVSGTILLVEDEETLRNMGTTLLEAMGFSALTAQHGREALVIYHERSSEIDVVMLDLIMPVMGGIETYHELRKSAPDLPIIICSGYNVESVENVINNDRHAGFMNKPYKPEQLRDVLLTMIETGSGLTDC